mmetsp:Transcript_10107/g.15437  ORF Transcript_10107/g.15437 Transcript_10107/m.15437 type:complete len:92 (-) Transcript_10107:1022-1297(-)
MKKLDLANISQDRLILSVEVAEAEERSGENLTFTWRAIQFDGRMLVIEIEWAHPSALSPLVELDTLKCLFPGDLFISAESLRVMEEDSRFL